MEQVRGADVTALKTMIQMIMFQSYPIHPHCALKFQTPLQASLEPILYTTGQTPAVIQKLKQFIQDENISLEDGEWTLLEAMQVSSSDKTKPVSASMLKLIGAYLSF